MSYRYASLDNLIKDLLPASVDNADETEAIGRVLDGVSNFIDKFTRRPEKYFMPVASNAVPTPRYFCGEGNNFLRIPVHVGIATIADVDASLFYEHQENGWLYLTPNEIFTGDPFFIPSSLSNRVFAENARFRVSAKWGFAETPAGISEAARELTLRTWETQRGIFGQLTPAGTVVERAMPPIVEEILLTFRRRQFEIS